jgi:hypothetical protein
MATNQRHSSQAVQRRQKEHRDRPPDVIVSIPINHKVRFANVAAGTLNFTLQINDFAQLWVVAATSTTAFCLFDALRIRKIEMWFAASVASTSSSALIEDYQTTNSVYLGAPSRTKVSSMPSPGENGYIVWTPKKGSVQDSWFNTAAASTAPILRMTMPANAVIDLTFSATLADGTNSPTQTTTAVSGATAGQVYCRALGCSNSTTQCPPIGISTL